MDKLLVDIKDSFEKLDLLLNSMMLQYSLIPIKEHCLTEEDEISIESDFKSYKIEFKNIINLIMKFMTIDKPIKESGFVKNINRHIEMTKDLYNDIAIKNTNDKYMKKVNDAYFAYMMIVRVLNTAIKNYNLNFPKYTISELDIDEPKYIDNADDLMIYFEEYIKNINDILNI